MKVLLEPETEKILGVHIVGAEASILIQGYVYLLEAGKDRAPFLGEVISDEGKKPVKQSQSTISRIKPLR